MNNKYKHLDFQILDLVALIVAFYVACHLRNAGVFESTDAYRFLLVTLLFIEIIVSYFYQPYKNILKRGFLVELEKTVVFSFISFIMVVLVLYTSKTAIIFSRIVVVSTYIIYTLLTYVIRIIHKLILRLVAKNSIEKGKTSLLIICNDHGVDKLINNIKKENFENYRIAGLCVLDKDRKGENLSGIEIVANREDVLSYVCHQWVDEVFIDMPYSKVPSEIIRGIATAGISLHVRLSKIKELEGRKQTVSHLFGETVLFSEVRYRSNLERVIKRLMDIVGSIVGIILMGLIALIIGPMIYKKSPGPIFYKQKRIGKNGQIFEMYKFRSMVLNADELKAELMSQNRIKDGMMFKVEHDPRIIPGVGEFIRKTSLDEFPQFINVLKGDMSLVGTRPPTLDEWIKYNLEHRIRMNVKPGITGMWQANGRSEITDFNKVVELDRDYVNNWSLTLDIKLLFKTVKNLLVKEKGAM